MQTLYSEMAASGGEWKVQVSPKHRRDERRKNNVKAVSSNHGNTGTTLRGTKPQKTVTLYVRNVTMKNNDTETDIMESVKGYGVANGLDILNVYLIYNRYSDNIVGCKINVPEDQVETALCESFWPTDISCRLWQKQRSRDPARSTGAVTQYNNEDGMIRRTFQHSTK